MTKHDKLLQSVFNATVSIRFEDACKVAELIGFSQKGGQGSHAVYGRDDELKRYLISKIVMALSSPINFDSYETW